MASAIDNGPFEIQGTSVQLNPSELLALKQSFLQNPDVLGAPSVGPSDGVVSSNGQTSQGEEDDIITSKPGAAVLWDTSYLSSLKESFQSSLVETSSVEGSPVSVVTQPSTSGVVTINPTIVVDKPQDEIEIPQPDIDPPQTGVEIPTNEEDPPQTGIEIPINGVKPPQPGFENPDTEIDIPQLGVEIPNSEIDPPLTELEFPLTDIDVPSNGPEIILPPDLSVESNTNAPGSEDNTAVTSVPENQGGFVGAAAQEALGLIPIPGVVTAPVATPDLDSSSSSTTNQATNNNNNPSSGGIINNVVNGIASGIGGGANNGIGGLQVDLGPVLDAVATLLRGPIRSAIANRRSEYQQRSDNVVPRTKAAYLPSVARITEADPNIIPIGNYGRESINERPIEDPNIIPLNYERNNGPVPLGLVAAPRIDIQREEQDDQDFYNLSPEVIERVQKSQNKNNPIYVDENRVIINDHIIKQDHEIIDVLSRNEQGHLFGRENGQPMAIKILPGTPMNIQNSVNTPPQHQDEPPKNEGGFFANFENPLLGLIKAFDNNQNKKQDGPPPPPPPPPPPRQPNNKPGPPRRPLEKRPHQNQNSQHEQPNNVRQQPPQLRPPQPLDLEESNDLDDSVQSFSTNNEVIVEPPANIFQDNLHQQQQQQFSAERPPPQLPVHGNNNENKAQILGKPPPQGNRPPFGKRPPPKRAPPPPPRNNGPNPNRPPPQVYPGQDPRNPQEKIQINNPNANRLPPPPPPPHHQQQQSHQQLGPKPQLGPHQGPQTQPGPPQQQGPQQQLNPQKQQGPAQQLGPQQQLGSQQPQLQHQEQQQSPQQQQQQTTQQTFAPQEQRFPQEKIEIETSNRPPARPYPTQEPQTAQDKPQITNPPPSEQPPYGLKFNPNNKPLRRPPPPPPSPPTRNPPTNGPRLRPRPNTPHPDSSRRPPYQPQKPRVPEIYRPEAFTQDPNQIARLDVINPNGPKVNYNFNSPALDSGEIDQLDVSRPFGNRNPPYPENPNKQRQSSVNNIAPDTTESALYFVVETKIQAETDAPILVHVGEPHIQGELLDPSFLVTTNPVIVSTEGIEGVAPPPRRISQSQIKPKNTIDKEGWRTEGDDNGGSTIIQPSTAAFDIILKETEAPKTITYANEWSTYEEQPSKVQFIPQVRPEPSTNFEREWTVRDDATIKPSRQYDTLLPATSTSSGYASNNWQTFDSEREPAVVSGGLRVEKDAKPVIEQDDSSKRRINGPFNFNRNPNLNNNFRPSQEEDKRPTTVSRTPPPPPPPRPTFPSFTPAVITQEEEEEEDKLTTAPNLPPRTNGHGTGFRPSQPQEATEAPLLEFPVIIGPQLPESGLPYTPESDIVVGRPPVRPEADIEVDYRPLPPRPRPNQGPDNGPPRPPLQNLPTRPTNPNKYRRPIPPRNSPPPPFINENEASNPLLSFINENEFSNPPSSFTNENESSNPPLSFTNENEYSNPTPSIINENESGEAQQFFQEQNQIPFRPNNNIRLPSNDVNSIDLAPETTREATTIAPTQSIFLDGITDDDEKVDDETIPPTRPTPSDYQSLASTQETEPSSRPNFPIVNEREEENIQVIEGTFVQKPVTPIISDFTRTVEADFNRETISSTAFPSSEHIRKTNSTRIRFSIVNKPALIVAEETSQENEPRPFSRPSFNRPTRPIAVSPTTKSTSSVQESRYVSCYKHILICKGAFTNDVTQIRGGG